MSTDSINYIDFIFQLGFHDEATFAMTVRGNSKLLHEGYEYTKSTVTNGFTNWRCCRCRWEQCKGKAKTIKIGLKEMVKAYDLHNHDPENTGAKKTD